MELRFLLLKKRNEDRGDVTLVLENLETGSWTSVFLRNLELRKSVFGNMQQEAGCRGVLVATSIGAMLNVAKSCVIPFKVSSSP